MSACYQDLPPPWQPGDPQVLAVAFQPMVLTTFTVPLLWVAAFVVVAL